MLEKIAKNKDGLVDALDRAKGIDIKSFEVTKTVSYADWIVVVTGDSTPHMKSLVREAERAMHKVGVKPIGEEGMNDETGWILIDFGDIVLHIFSEEKRDFYQIEKIFVL